MMWRGRRHPKAPDMITEDLHAGISSARGSAETQRLRSAAGVVRLRISGPFDVPTRRSLAN